MTPLKGKTGLLEASKKLLLRHHRKSILMGFLPLPTNPILLKETGEKQACPGDLASTGSSPVMLATPSLLLEMPLTGIACVKLRSNCFSAVTWKRAGG